MGNKYIGKGLGLFSSVKIMYYNKFISLKLEPSFMINNNENVTEINRGMPGNLNDVRIHKESPYLYKGIREGHFFFHYNSVGIGISNENLWWGPGIHSSLTMTNNTTGFPHIRIGTLKEKMINNLGFNLHYIFSKLDKTKNQPYFTALTFSITAYTDPFITVGFVRNFLSNRDENYDKSFNAIDAAMLVFDNLFLDTKVENYSGDWPVTGDPWDQTMSGFVSLEFPESFLHLYLEIGTNDHRQNWSDLRSNPEHASASIIGLRKYRLFNNNNLVAGLEYTNLILARTWKFRETPNWYNKPEYDYSSYDGRRWAAHSGSDSDDLYIYIGYQSDKWSFIPAFNYERHGVLLNRPPEVKMEIRLDIRYVWNNYKFNIYIEKEWIEHANFEQDKWRTGSVIWFGFERDLTKIFFNKLNMFSS
jgi:hypothetical protein